MLLWLVLVHANEISEASFFVTHRDFAAANGDRKKATDKSQKKKEKQREREKDRESGRKKERVGEAETRETEKE